MGARIGAVHDGLVGPFEVERLDQRFADARVFELVAAGIDEPALGARRSLGGQCFTPDAAVLHGGEIIARCPDPRSELFAVQVAPCGKPLERDVAIPIEFVTHSIEIIAAAGNWKPGAPPIPDPLELDVAIDLEFPDLVWPAPQGDIERR